MTTYMLRPYAGRMRTRSRFQEGVHVPVNVSITEDTFHISAYLPGIRAEDVEIEILEDRVAISGEFAEMAEDEGMRLLRTELPTGRFHRSFRLGAKLDSEKAEAIVKDGILSLSVPKAEEARTRKIAVRAK